MWRALLREASDRALLMTQFVCCYHVFTNYVMDVTMCMGPSMLPTLNATGDVVLLEHISTQRKLLKPGDVVVARSPTNPRMVVCKRVTATEGATVQMTPPSAGAAAMGASAFGATRQVLIPPGHVWLQGDNLNNSTDSRHYGPVPLALVKGKVFYRIWPPKDCGPVH